MIGNDDCHEWHLYYKCSLGGVNDTSRVVRMTIKGDTPTWSITYDGSRGVIYDRNIFIIRDTGWPENWKNDPFLKHS